MPPAQRTGTCPNCGGTMRESRRDPGQFICDRCARHLPESEVEGVTEPSGYRPLEADL